MKIYGIKNCDTVRKALKWLDDHNVRYEFHDFKKSGISEEKLEEWSAKIGWESLVNKRGTTWKKLDVETQNLINNRVNAFRLMQDKTSVIRRPVLEDNEKLVLGFDAATYQDTVG